jgi:hypothetical protein
VLRAPSGGSFQSVVLPSYLHGWHICVCACCFKRLALPFVLPRSPPLPPLLTPLQWATRGCEGGGLGGWSHGGVSPVWTVATVLCLHDPVGVQRPLHGSQKERSVCECVVHVQWACQAHVACLQRLRAWTGPDAPQGPHATCLVPAALCRAARMHGAADMAMLSALKCWCAVPYNTAAAARASHCRCTCER